MNSKLKNEILKALQEIAEKSKNENNIDLKLENMSDILNVVKIIENYDELEPEIKNMLNKKARKDKWGER